MYRLFYRVVGALVQITLGRGICKGYIVGAHVQVRSWEGGGYMYRLQCRGSCTGYINGAHAQVTL